jgi:hypothetical protein
MRSCVGILLATLLLSGSAVYGDTSPPPFKCVKPMKQHDFATEVQVERYRSVVELYRSCLDAFVKEQQKAIEIHRQAAQSAIDDWNEFVRPDAKK